MKIEPEVASVIDSPNLDFLVPHGSSEVAIVMLDVRSQFPAIGQVILYQERNILLLY